MSTLWEIKAQPGDLVRRTFHRDIGTDVRSITINEFVIDRITSDGFVYAKSGAFFSADGGGWEILKRAERPRNEEDYPLGTVVPFKSEHTTGYMVRAECGWLWVKGQLVDWTFEELRGNKFVQWDQAKVPGVS